MNKLQIAAIFIILIMVFSAVAGFILLVLGWNEGDFIMARYNIGAVVAEFNYDITQMMLGLAKEEAKQSK